MTKLLLDCCDGGDDMLNTCLNPLHKLCEECNEEFLYTSLERKEEMEDKVCAYLCEECFPIYAKDDE